MDCHIGIWDHHKGLAQQWTMLLGQMQHPAAHAWFRICLEMQDMLMQGLIIAHDAGLQLLYAVCDAKLTACCVPHSEPQLAQGTYVMVLPVSTMTSKLRGGLPSCSVA